MISQRNAITANADFAFRAQNGNSDVTIGT